MKLGLQEIVSLFVNNVNAFGLGGASVSLEEQAGSYAFRIKARNASIASGTLEGVRIDDLALQVSNIKLGLTSEEMLKAVKINVERLAVRMNADLINSFLSSPAFLAELKRNAPVEIRGLRLVFDDEMVTIRGEVRKILTFPFSIELRFSPTADNSLKIVFENFWAADMLPLPSMVRRLIMSFAQQKLGSLEGLRGVLKITDDYIVINPWPKVPLNVNARFTGFGVEGHYFILELGPDTRSSAKEVKKVVDKPEIRKISAPPAPQSTEASLPPFPPTW
ncbi:MAG: hypothetical protein ACI38Q_03040 [Candidatus Bruticola sp.]